MQHFRDQGITVPARSYGRGTTEKREGETMELGLHFTELTCCEQTGRLVMSHEETMETAIAEYCPDMTRIVSVCGQLQIRERTALEGRVTATGTVRVTVLYTSEESAGLRSLTLPVPFSCTAEDETLASSQLLWATGRLLLAEAQAVTARKLYVRVLPEVTLTGYTRAQCRFCSGTEEDPALRVRRRDHDISLLDTAAERSFSVAQETPEVSPAPEDLLLYRLCPRLTSCRLVGSKLVVKGELALSALYRGRISSCTPMKRSCRYPRSWTARICRRRGSFPASCASLEGRCGSCAPTAAAGSPSRRNCGCCCGPTGRCGAAAWRTCTAFAGRCSCIRRRWPYRWGGPAAPCGRRAFSIWTSAAAARSSLSPTRTAHLLP